MQKSLILIFLLFLGCGVKGDPSPPDPPAFIGRGEPNYVELPGDSAYQDLEFEDVDSTKPKKKKKNEGEEY